MRNQAIRQTDYHLTYNTKYRKKVLVGVIAKKTEIIIRDIAKNYQCSIKNIKVMPDHIHLLISISPDKKVSDVVKNIKGASSYYLFREFPEIRKKLSKGHLWAPSYFIRSTSNVTIQTINRYISKQKEINVK